MGRLGYRRGACRSWRRASATVVSRRIGAADQGERRTPVGSTPTFVAHAGPSRTRRGGGRQR